MNPDSRAVIITPETTTRKPNTTRTTKTMSNAKKTFVNIAAVVICLILTAAAALAAMIECPSCRKSIDSSNSLCPYCLAETSPKADVKPAKPADTGSADKIDYSAPPQRNVNSSSKPSRLLTEQEVQTFVDEKVISRIQNDTQKIKVDSVKKEKGFDNKFRISGKVYNKNNTPMQTVGAIIEKLSDQQALSNVNLIRAAKADVNVPNVVNFNLTMTVDATLLAPIAKKPFQFNFTVPASSSKPSPDQLFNIKILKKTADSEDIMYDMQNKAGDKVSLTLIPEGGMTVIVFIDGLKAYEKKY